MTAAPITMWLHLDPRVVVVKTTDDEKQNNVQKKVETKTETISVGRAACYNIATYIIAEEAAAASKRERERDEGDG